MLFTRLHSAPPHNALARWKSALVMCGLIQLIIEIKNLDMHRGCDFYVQWKEVR